MTYKVWKCDVRTREKKWYGTHKNECPIENIPQRTNKRPAFYRSPPGHLLKKSCKCRHNLSITQASDCSSTAGSDFPVAASK